MIGPMIEESVDVTVADGAALLVAFIVVIAAMFGRRMGLSQRDVNRARLEGCLHKIVVLACAEGKQAYDLRGRVEAVGEYEASIKDVHGRLVSVPLTAIQSIRRG
jgi:hypothetical protein